MLNVAPLSLKDKGLVTRFTIDSELDLSGGVASSIGSCTDELSALISRSGVDEEATFRIQGEGWTTQVQQLPTLKNKLQEGKGRGRCEFH